MRLVRSGAVGEVRYVHAAFAFGGIGAENVRLQKALEGGALMDVGCYCVSALRLLCGEPVRVSGEQVLGGDGVDVRFAGLMRFESDVVATFDCGMDVHRHQGIQIVGSEGSIDVPQPWQTWEGPKIVVVRGEESETLEPPGVDPYAAELDDMAAAIAAGRARPGSGVRSPSGRRGRSRRSTRPPRRVAPSRCEVAAARARARVAGLSPTSRCPRSARSTTGRCSTSVARAVGGELTVGPQRLPARR